MRGLVELFLTQNLIALPGRGHSVPRSAWRPRFYASSALFGETRPADKVELLRLSRLASTEILT